MAWLEQFQAWKRLGYPDMQRLAARDAHAMLILERELSAEAACGQE